MKAVLIVPPRPYLFEQKALPPLGVLTAAAVFKKQGWDVEVLDFADGYRFVEADVHGISVNTPDLKACIQILKQLKKDGARKVIAGGPHATLMPQECLDAGFDMVSVGDGEVTIPSILNAVEYEGGLSQGWLRDIDEAPHPDRTCLDLKEYNFRIKSLPATSLMTTFGCAWGRCAFCSRVFCVTRYHSLEWVKEDLKQISDLGFSAVQIYDDEFFTFPKRDEQIIKTLNRMGFTWRVFGNSRFILKNKGLLFQAAESNLYEVLLGIESGSDQILTNINKGTTVKANIEAIEYLHSLGVRVKAAMIIMLPGESEVTLKQTWRFCEKMDQYVSEWDFTMLVPYPGSRIYAHPEQFDIKFDKKKVYQAYKGAGTEAWDPTPISTSKLSFEEGLILREALEKRFKYREKELCFE